MLFILFIQNYALQNAHMFLGIPELLLTAQIFVMYQKNLRSLFLAVPTAERDSCKGGGF